MEVSARSAVPVPDVEVLSVVEVLSPAKYHGQRTGNSPVQDLPRGGDDAYEAKTFKAAGGATVAASALNLINNVVGAGLFSMPWAMKRATVLPGLAICLATCLVNGLCYILLAKSCEAAQAFTYLSIGTKAFGPAFGNLAQLCVLFYSLGSSLSFVVLVGDFLSGDTGVFPYSREAVTWGVAAVVFLPLSFLRNTEALKFSSFASFVACFGAAWLVVNTALRRPDEAFLHPAPLRPEVDYFALNSAMFSSVPVMNVAFTAHYNAPRFYQELKDRSVAGFATVIALAMGFAFCVYASVGVCGYLTFGDATKGSILLNYSPTWRAAVVARVFLALVVMFTFPLSNHAVRESIFSLATNGRLTTNNAPRPFFAAATLALVAVSVVVGLYFKDIEKVLAVKGAVFGTAVVYLFPPLIYARLNEVAEAKRRDAAAPPPPVCPRRLVGRLGGLALIPVWGVSTAVVGLYMLFFAARRS
eukprot:TRINITY_DN30036_c0_g1_i1.p1 TRINITY_DN30036_c0_g1~~TRINITY_DN30036_c0_g1_i1.p1  ORF type:complete len:472 (+),score=183.46 TRINITY_DN30036_c0_g1_i1:105-1520(+)